MAKPSKKQVQDAIDYANASVSNIQAPLPVWAPTHVLLSALGYYNGSIYKVGQVMSMVDFKKLQVGGLTWLHEMHPEVTLSSAQLNAVLQGRTDFEALLGGHAPSMLASDLNHVANIAKSPRLGGYADAPFDADPAIWKTALGLSTIMGGVINAYNVLAQNQGLPKLDYTEEDWRNMNGVSNTPANGGSSGSSTLDAAKKAAEDLAKQAAGSGSSSSGGTSGSGSIPGFPAGIPGLPGSGSSSGGRAPLPSSATSGLSLPAKIGIGAGIGVVALLLLGK